MTRPRIAGSMDICTRLVVEVVTVCDAAPTTTSVRANTGGVNQHHGQVAAAKGEGQGGRALHDLGQRMHGRIADEALLQVDHDQGRPGIEASKRHGGPP